MVRVYFHFHLKREEQNHHMISESPKDLLMRHQYFPRCLLQNSACYISARRSVDGRMVGTTEYEIHESKVSVLFISRPKYLELLLAYSKH